MDRRLFLLAGTAWSLRASAEPPAGGWRPGVHYVVVDGYRALNRPGRVAVADVFSYTCIHCYRLESHLQAWLQRKPAYVDFVRIPIQWNEKQQAYARLYYTLQVLTRTDLHEAVFSAIQVQKASLYTADPTETLALQLKFASQHGVAADEFTRARDSAAVATALRADSLLLDRLPTTATPTIAVNGKYVTDPARCPDAANHTDDVNLDSLLEITDHLVSIAAT